MLVPSYHYLVGPLVAFAALFVICLICKWVFSTSDRDRRAERRRAAALSSRGGDYGLLVPVATAPTPADGEMLREVLREAGIRCTLAGPEVLVFRADAARARDLVRS